MRPIYAALLVIGMILLIAMVLGIILATFRFFLWIGIVGLIIWGIYALVTHPWRNG